MKPAPPSSEQQAVIDAIKAGYSVQVNAVAGAGKTTTVMNVADQLPDMTILMFTYNHDLKEDVAVKIQRLQKTRQVSVWTFHGFAYKYYSTDACKDDGVDRVVRENFAPLEELPHVDLLVLDECQDMTLGLFAFVAKVLKDMRIDSLPILVLGDHEQGLYDFKGADTRFLTYANQIWAPFTRRHPFVNLVMSESFRLTSTMASFVNEVMLGESRIVSRREGGPVIYLRHSEYRMMVRLVFGVLMEQFRVGGLYPQDVAVLHATVKSEKSMVKLLENMLVHAGIPCFVPTNETISIDKTVIENKVVFASFHQMKGRERKWVVVCGFDENYFNYYCRDISRALCPSTLYVAATRAIDRLIVLEVGEPLTFLRKTHADMVESEYVDFRGVPQGVVDIVSTQGDGPLGGDDTLKLTVTGLLKFLDSALLSRLTELMDKHLFVVDESEEGRKDVKVPNVTASEYRGRKLTEEVYDLNGHALPAMYQEKYHGTNAIKQEVMAFLERNTKNVFYRGILSEVDWAEPSIEDHLRIVNVYVAMKENLLFKAAQITDYTWLEKPVVDAIFENMDRRIERPESLLFEQVIATRDESVTDYQRIDRFVVHRLGADFPKVRFEARVDAMSPDVLWEFKCTAVLEAEHRLQLLLYAWIYRKTVGKKKTDMMKFRLMNIRTGETHTLNYEAEWVDQIVEELLRSKYRRGERWTDAEFLKNVSMHHASLET